MQSTLRREAVITAALIGLMVATRGGFFSAAVDITLHDASWAAFLLAGLMLHRVRTFAVLAGVALAMDYMALCFGADGGLGACLRPSYSTLPLAWLIMWFAGRRLARAVRHAQPVSAWVGLIGGASVATALAYTISSGSFYALSGFYTDLALGDYLRNTLPFAGWTVLYTTLYVAGIGAVWFLTRPVADTEIATT